jgi:uncharacterized protein YyaL (SSP411 family)
MAVSTLNSLAQASSSYLRSAMHQPIQWHEWGDDAFGKAKRENKPILLDIGAVWCHWCHVMDRESYEDPETAQIINERFVAIKVDRDERPDIDSRYQGAVQAITGQGGWPLTGFLLPDGRPFYGGTYFPPHDMQGRPSFRRVLLAISDAFHEKNGDVTEQAQMVEGAIAHAESFTGKSGEFSPRVIQEIIESGLKMFDENNGGFGGAPKFPHASIVDLLIDQYVRLSGASLRRTAEGGRSHMDNAVSYTAELRNVFTVTLEKMARGGVYDQLAGGFHRYSVDERWIVPHFEKMSYDNSELLKNYVHAFQATGEEFFAEVARDIVRWVDSTLSDRERGGFYASQDADISLDDDGDYFTWTLEEAKVALNEEEFQAASLHYDINEIGEMQHDPMRNVLYQRASIDELTTRMKLPPQRVREILQSAKKKMYTERLKRQTPYIDKTLYTNWNALFVSAYLKTASALNLEEAKHFALRSLDRILAEAWIPEFGLKHVVAYSGVAAAKRDTEGFLDDYAYTANACLDAYESTAVLAYFREAQQITDKMIEKFYDNDSGGFLDSAPKPAAPGVLATPRKPFQDSPTPAGNPVAAIVLLRMHGYTGEDSYREKATRSLGLLAGTAGQYGLFAGTYGIAATYASYPHSQIVIIGDDEAASQLHSQAISSGLMGRSVIKLKFSQAVAQNLPPSLAATIPELPAVRAGRTTAVVCSGFSCKPPVDTSEELQQLLSTDIPAA